MLRTLLAISAITIGITAVAAQSDPIQQRNALMKSMWKDGFSIPYRMASGKEPFDKAKADAGFAKMAEIVAQLPPLWPAGSNAVPPLPKYSSSSKIWENKPDFEAKLAALTKSIADNRNKTKDVASLKSAVGEVNKACDNCHERYQVKNQ
jgi:cytochrome c556